VDISLFLSLRYTGAFFVKSINSYTTAIFNTNGIPFIISVFTGSKCEETIRIHGILLTE